MVAVEILKKRVIVRLPHLKIFEYPNFVNFYSFQQVDSRDVSYFPVKSILSVCA